ncbi:hypothetical protein [Cedecea davisae]|nr:hypothetical protein [Cedecea davisae]
MNIIQQFAQRGHQLLRDAVLAAPLKNKEIGPGEFIRARAKRSNRCTG